MSEVLLEIDNLTVAYRGAEAVRQASLTVRNGECVVLLGESGSGKTTLALAVSRLLPEPVARIAHGAIRFSGQDILRLEEREMRALRGRDIVMVFQEPQTALNPVRTIGQHLKECFRGWDRGRTREILLAVGLPDSLRILRKYPHQLSGGMRQRAMIAMALMPGPRLMIADEPTSALDVTVQAQILQLLRSQQQAMGLLFVTHDLKVAGAIADTVVVLYRGEIMETAPRESFFGGPGHPYSQALFAAAPDKARRGISLRVALSREGSASPCAYAARCALRIPLCDAVAPPWQLVGESRIRCHRVGEAIVAIRGVAVGAKAQQRVPARQTPLLEVRDLRVGFPGAAGRSPVEVVRGVSFRVEPGQTTALVGESGSGKTTIARSLLRLIPATSGAVTFLGQDWLGLSKAALWARRSAIQMIFQDPHAALNPRLDAAAIVTEGLHAQGVRYGVPDVARLLQQVGLSPDVAHRYPHQFSGGQRQRLAIARALAVQPQLLVCDEPTSALDVSVQAQILNLLVQLQQQTGVSYLLITHNIALVEYLAHDVLVLYDGQIVERGPVGLVLQRPQHPYTQSLVLAASSPGAPVEDHGGPRSSADSAGGCSFRQRCPRVQARCGQLAPPEQEFGAAWHARCYYPLHPELSAD